MRTGPQPLFMHLGMARSELQSDDGERHGIHSMIEGIQRYQKHTYYPPRTQSQEIWRNNTVTLRALSTEYDADAPVCLLVPSIINGSSILDLNEERSFARWLTENGVNVYLLDWGALCDDPENMDVSKLVEERLCAAIDFLHHRQGVKIHVFGYCVGGTLATSLAVLRPDFIESLVLLATPWDFQRGQKALYNRVNFWAPSALPVVRSSGRMPMSWLHMLFASLDEGFTCKKYKNFAKMPDDSTEARLFIAVEDWLNAGEDLPEGVALNCVEDWFLGNAPVQKEWYVGARKIDTDEIDCPALVVASKRDHLIDFEMAVSLHEHIPHSVLLDPDCGHIGMMAGRNAIDQVWAPIRDWILGAYKSR